MWLYGDDDDGGFLRIFQKLKEYHFFASDVPSSSCEVDDQMYWDYDGYYQYDHLLVSCGVMTGKYLLVVVVLSACQ